MALQIISYWYGELPQISKLHFISFQYNNNLNAKYTFYIDQESKSEFENNKPDWLDDLDIDIIFIDLYDLMNKYGISPFHRELSTSIHKTISKALLFMIRLSNYVLRRLPNWMRIFIAKRTTYNLEMGLSLKHSNRFSNLIKDLPYRSDIFRSLIIGQLENDDILYVDIDVIFVKKLALIDLRQSFVSQWGSSDYGNSAILFLTKKDQAISKIISRLQKTNSARPWALYSNINCQNYNLQISPIRFYDPSWAFGSPIYGKPEYLMMYTKYVSLIIKYIEQNCIFVHWHNQWKTIPDLDSPYGKYVERFTVKNN
jgi:hypothetical protein